MIELKHINKTYRSGKLELPVLFDINLTINRGEFVAIMGPSGSGKSTLMNIIGLLDRPTSGQYLLENEPITLNMSDRKLANLRSSKIGFIFQTFNLLPRINAWQNVLLPAAYKRKSANPKTKAQELLERVKLGNRLKHKPPELSGGEKQRVAIARALINDPDIILADEPTGNLDSKSGHEVMDALSDLNAKDHKTIIVITHDKSIAARCQRVINLFDGKITEGES